MSKCCILYYANGNNELEPEIWQSFLNIKNIDISDNIEIIVQISREDKKTTEIMRPDLIYPNFEENWKYTRRYKIGNKKSELLEDLGNENMADPKTLENFIIWAKNTYKSEKTILILGGHIYQFIGISPDFSQEKPYIMGIPALATAIQNSCIKTNSQVDLLILDTCYASTFEVLSEFAKFDFVLTKNILTYIGGGPLFGLPYNIIITIIDIFLSKNIDIPFDYIIKNIVDVLPKFDFISPLIGLKIDKQAIENCKNEFSQISYKYLINKNLYPQLKLPYHLLGVDDKYPWFENLLNIHKNSNSIIIQTTPEPFYNRNGLPIHVLYKNIPDLTRKKLYKQSFFCLNNYWTNLICDEDLDKHKTYIHSNYSPSNMNENVLEAFIKNMNSEATYSEITKIKKDLMDYKNWKNLIKGENKMNYKNLTIGYYLPHTNLTGGLKMLLQQMKELKKLGHRIYIIFKSDKKINEIKIDWETLEFDKQIIINKTDDINDFINDCDVIMAGWVTQLVEFSNSNIPVVYWEQGHEWLFDDISPIYDIEKVNKLLEYCYKGDFKILSVSKFVSEVLQRKYDIKTEILTNGIDNKLFYPSDTKDENTILLVGNYFLNFKNFALAINALNIVWKLGYKFKVKWVCQQHPITDNILFPLEIIIKPPQKELAKLYREATMHIFTSKYEGFGMPPLEAMASGTSVICTDCGGVNDFAINDYNCYIVGNDDINDLATYIIYLLKHPEVRARLENNGVNTALKHDYSKIILKLEKYLKDIISL